jgi:hypothetical protein
MSFLIPCLACGVALRVMGDAGEIEGLVGPRSDFWPDRFPCPTCGALASAVTEIAAEPRALARMRLVDLTPHEAFAALQGFGLPHERACTRAEVEALLREQPVRRVGGSDVPGASRCCIEHLELWDGTRVHFGASAQGAVVFRVTRPPSYAERVLHEHRD